AQFSPDGRMVVTGGGAVDKTARLWDTRTSQLIGEPFLHPCGLKNVGFSSDGARVVTVGFDRAIRSWNVRSPNVSPKSEEEKLQTESTASLRVNSSDGRCVLIANPGEPGARLWDVATGKPIGPILNHPDAVSALAFAPDNQSLATGDVNGTV